jgi:fumarate hydratase class II
MVKREAALVNAALGVVSGLDHDMGRAIARAAGEVCDGLHDHQFPVDVYQSGSGTSWNMNANEVIAHRAAELLGRPVHPNDHVNAGQSSNDVVPTVVRLSCALALRHSLRPAATDLRDSLAAASDRLAAVVTTGRTHLADAVPLTLGQQLGGWAAQVDEAVERLDGLLPRLCRLPLGGTAVGTGLNCPPGFAEGVAERLAAATGLPLVEAPDHFAAQGAHDAAVELSAALRSLALVLAKVSSDLRLLASGPATGFGEVRLPVLAPGSSIMPGKVNPVVPEAVLQVAARMVGNDATAAFATTIGELQLGAHLPVLGHVLWESLELGAAACRLLGQRCVEGLEADPERCRSWAERSPALVTALAPAVGYEAAAAAVHRSGRESSGIAAAAVAEGLLDESTAATLLDPARLVSGGLPEPADGSDGALDLRAAELRPGRRP